MNLFVTIVALVALVAALVGLGTAARGSRPKGAQLAEAKGQVEAEAEAAVVR